MKPKNVEYWLCVEWNGIYFKPGKVYEVVNGWGKNEQGGDSIIDVQQKYSKWHKISLEDYYEEAKKI